eukprot:SAG31_NODE_43449_length_267_cov_0.613095_1_plen_31_part_10
MGFVARWLAVTSAPLTASAAAQSVISTGETI